MQKVKGKRFVYIHSIKGQKMKDKKIKDKNVKNLYI